MGSDSFVFIIFSSVLVVSDLCNPIMLDTNQSRAQSKKGLPVSSNKNDFLSNYSVKNGGLRRSDKTSVGNETNEIRSKNIVDKHDEDILAMASFYDRPEYT